MGGPLFWACLLLGITLAAGRAEDGRVYEMTARLDTPANLTFPGEIGELCLRAVRKEFSLPAAQHRRVRHGDILSLLPDLGRAGWGDSTGPGRVGHVFPVANSSAVLGWLSQLHPGARHSRYHALDPDVRPVMTAVGILAAASDAELLFLFRVHAEFQLSSTPALFVMPGSFEATLHVSRDLQAVHIMDIRVPTERTFNVLFECGDAFASLGDNIDDSPASPDGRRLSEFRIPFVRREPKTSVEEAAIEEAADSGLPMQEHADHDQFMQTDTAAESCIAESQQVEGERGAGGTAGGRASQVEGASAKLGLGFFPGEDADFLAERAQDEDGRAAENEEESRAFRLSLQTSVQEAHFPAISLSLQGLPPSGGGTVLAREVLRESGRGEDKAARAAEAPPALALSRAESQAKLAIALYPFLDVGYTQDYAAAYLAAGAAKKPLLAVVLWGALDDASC